LNPFGPCELAAPPTNTTVSFGGKLANGTFALLLNRGGYTFNVKSTCHFPAPVGDITTTIPTPLSPFENFAISTPAVSGKTTTMDLGNGITLSVTMIRRK